jgi:hypothetical protein
MEFDCPVVLGGSGWILNEFRDLYHSGEGATKLQVHDYEIGIGGRPFPVDQTR